MGIFELISIILCVSPVNAKNLQKALALRACPDYFNTHINPNNQTDSTPGSSISNSRDCSSRYSDSSSRNNSGYHTTRPLQFDWKTVG